MINKRSVANMEDKILLNFKDGMEIEYKLIPREEQFNLNISFSFLYIHITLSKGLNTSRNIPNVGVCTF
jgi:hypothetical protein